MSLSARIKICIAVACLLIVTASLTFRTPRYHLPALSIHHDTPSTEVHDEKLHLLLPATQGNVDLCKTLLSAKILGYPTPGLLAWGESYDSPTQMAGGSHLAKIFRVLDYLNGLPPSQDSKLVMMLDAYDIWFQLHPDVLINRFQSINDQADARNLKYFGFNVKQKIIFGAGKRCAPNQLHTVACYPIPPSPLPDDLYSANTDTVFGRNKYSSHRQRYLNSGYIMGRASDLRKLFAAAAEEVHDTPDHADFDNGSGGSDFVYHGSDQSIFSTLMGRQEYMRQYQLDNRQPVELEGTIIPDPINPPFTHETMDPPADPWAWEFGIGLDYFSDLGHQTVNSEFDAKWLTFADDPLDTDFPGKNEFDCPSRANKSALDDIWSSSPAPEGGWDKVPLYTHLCLNRVPCMLHFNGDKNARAYRWRDMWWHASSRAMLQADQGQNIALTDKGDTYHWEDLCGAYTDMFD